MDQDQDNFQKESNVNLLSLPIELIVHITSTWHVASHIFYTFQKFDIYVTFPKQGHMTFSEISNTI